MNKTSKSFLLLALAGLAASVPAKAVPDITEVEAVESVSASGEIDIPEFWKVMESELESELASFRTELSAAFDSELGRVAEPEPDWNVNALDVEVHLSQLDGGIRGNGLLHLGDMPMLEFYDGVSASILEDWELVYEGAQSKSPLKSKSGIFTAISPRHVLFGHDDDLERLGNAYCLTHPIEEAKQYFQIFRDSRFEFDPDNEEDLDAEAQAIFIAELFSAIRLPEFCAIYREIEDSQLVGLAYLRDGRALSFLNEDPDKIVIVQDFDLRKQLLARYDSSFWDQMKGEGEAESPATETDD